MEMRQYEYTPLAQIPHGARCLQPARSSETLLSFENSPGQMTPRPANRRSSQAFKAAPH